MVEHMGEGAVPPIMTKSVVAAIEADLDQGRLGVVDCPESQKSQRLTTQVEIMQTAFLSGTWHMIVNLKT